MSNSQNAFRSTRCGECGRRIHTSDTDCERVSVPLRFLLYPIPILSYLIMIHMVKRFCCLPCKEQYEARHPNAWKSTFWWVHGVLFIPVLIYVAAFMAGEAPSPMQIWEEASANVKKIQKESSDKDENSSSKSEDTEN